MISKIVMTFDTKDRIHRQFFNNYCPSEFGLRESEFYCGGKGKAFNCYECWFDCLMKGDKVNEFVVHR